ncbi:TIR domain-containing protein [Tunturibacter psychrotolerans]|uniref:TIR domain-containing protein n=1 Tax=Tunturiibacter psychrotolerans TaxID=3069686 RepID=A0AAU7ZPR0_9BACT
MSTPSLITEQGFTGGFPVDLFISYGHIDNQANWITHLHSALQTRLQELLGTDQIVIWRDVKLNGLDLLWDTIRPKVTGSALFLSVLSPRYVSSDSCRQEVDCFVEAAERDNRWRSDTQSRLIRVVKTRLAEGVQQPLSFDATLGYEFYQTDDQNPDIFYEFGSQEGRPRFDNFAERVNVLAQTVARALLKFRQAKRATKPNVRTIFLSPTTRDLEQYRLSIQSELVGRGHNVIPTVPLPYTAAELVSTIESLLANADVSVQLIGRNYGLIPEEETRSLGELSYDLTLAQGARINFHQLIWIPEDLQNPENAQQTFITKLRGTQDEPAVSGKADVFETSFESFKEGVLDVLSQKLEVPPIPVAIKTKAVYLLCDQPDLKEEQLRKIKAYLRSYGYPVEVPVFQGDPEELRMMEEELILDTDAALIYYGTAKDLWVMRKRKSILKVLSSRPKGRNYTRALYLATPKDDIKAANYLAVSDHNYLEIMGFSPLLLLGDCEDFGPEKITPFIQLLEKEQ